VNGVDSQELLNYGVCSSGNEGVENLSSQKHESVHKGDLLVLLFLSLVLSCSQAFGKIVNVTNTDVHIII
jgi:hypothetical protein